MMQGFIYCLPAGPCARVNLAGPPPPPAAAFLDLAPLPVGLEVLWLLLSAVGAVVVEG